MLVEEAPDICQTSIEVGELMVNYVYTMKLLFHALISVAKLIATRQPNSMIPKVLTVNNEQIQSTIIAS